MSAIDLVVLGILKQQPMSAYDIQKAVDYRHISRWVKISTPSIYKKVLKLEADGLLSRVLNPQDTTTEKAIYALTAAGEERFVELMTSIAAQPVRLFLDFNAVIVNLFSLNEAQRNGCLEAIANNIALLQEQIGHNLALKSDDPSVPPEGLAVLQQQAALADTLATWLKTLRPQEPPA